MRPTSRVALQLLCMGVSAFLVTSTVQAQTETAPAKIYLPSHELGICDPGPCRPPPQSNKPPSSAADPTQASPPGINMGNCDPGPCRPPPGATDPQTPSGNTPETSDAKEVNRGSVVLHAPPPVPKGSRGPGKGELTGGPVVVGNCRLDTVRVTYDLGGMMGDPWGAARFAWDGTPCTLPQGTTLYLKIQYGDSVGWLRFQPASRPVAGGPPRGDNVVPFWSKLVCGFRGSASENCVDAQSAKRIYAAGKIIGFAFGWPTT